MLDRQSLITMIMSNSDDQMAELLEWSSQITCSLVLYQVCRRKLLFCTGLHGGRRRVQADWQLCPCGQAVAAAPPDTLTVLWSHFVSEFTLGLISASLSCLKWASL